MTTTEQFIANELERSGVAPGSAQIRYLERAPNLIDDRAMILGSLASKLKRTGKIIKTDFAIVLTVANGEIVRFQMLEGSFAVSQAARG